LPPDVGPETGRKKELAPQFRRTLVTIIVDTPNPTSISCSATARRCATGWGEDYAIAGVEGLDLHHLYRAMAWLGEELPEKEQDGRTPFAPRCVKDVVEERLIAPIDATC
jgi:hypothetical protein